MIDDPSLRSVQKRRSSNVDRDCLQLPVISRRDIADRPNHPPLPRRGEGINRALAVSETRRDRGSRDCEFTGDGAEGRGRGRRKKAGIKRAVASAFSLENVARAGTDGGREGGRVG